MACLVFAVRCLRSVSLVCVGRCMLFVVSRLLLVCCVVFRIRCWSVVVGWMLLFGCCLACVVGCRFLSDVCCLLVDVCVSSMLFVVCCWPIVVCCLLLAVCCVLLVVCRSLFDVGRVSFVTWCLLFVV